MFLELLRADGSPKSILGYASALDRMVKYLERNPTYMSDAGVISIIAMSESSDRPAK
jgi:phenylacetate-CoA ligase